MLDTKKEEIAQRGNAFFPIQYYWNNTSDSLYNLPVHWHREYEFIHVIEGTYKMVWGGEKVELHQNEYCIIQDGVLHGDDEKLENAKYESLVFDFNLLRFKNFAQDSFLNDIAEHRVILNKPLRIDNQNIRTEIDSIFLLMKEKASGYELFTVGKLLCLLGYIQQNKIYSEDEKVLDKNTNRTEQMKAVLNMISQNFSKPLTLDQMADIASMSPKYFCRIFREVTHRTPVEYLNAYRIDQACTLLRSSEESLIDISYQCGFNDFSYFIKTFKKYKGMTPHKYRTFDNRNKTGDELFFNHEQYFQRSPY